MDIIKYSYLVPLIIIIPLLVAIMLVFIKNNFIAWTSTCLTTLIVLGIISFILFKGGFTTISYNLGNFIPPFGIEYEIDALTIFFLFLISIIGFLTALWSKGTIIREVGTKNMHLFSAIFLLAFAGSLGVIVTNDLFNLFVFLEITSLTTYILIAMGQRKNSALAAFDSLIVGTISASFYLFGVGILYLLFGTLNANDLVVQINKAQMSPMFIIAIVSIALGILMKIALFPVFWWLPQTYESSPSPLSAFLAGTSVNIALYMLAKVIIIVIGRGSYISLENFFELLMILSIFSMFAGGILAIKQDNLKLLLAFSSVSQIGFIIMGVSLFNLYGISSALYLTIVHAFIKSGLFLCVGNLLYIFGTEKLSELRGMGRKSPYTYFVIIFLALSLAGVPGTSMFWGKLYLLIAVIKSMNIFIIISTILATILSFMYSWKIIYYLWLDKENTNASSAIMIHKKVPIYMNIALGIFVILNIYLTFFPEVTYFFIENIIDLNIPAEG